MTSTPRFLRAEPIWDAKPDSAPYATLGFRALISDEAGGGVLLLVAASSAYRAWLNGEFIAHGPSRCAKGHFRVDAIRVALQSGDNLLAIEVIHYGVNAFSHMDQPPFLRAEIQRDSTAIAATGTQGQFIACEVPGRLRHVQRYSYMRPMSEAYRLSPGWDDWRQSVDATESEIQTVAVTAKPLHPRRSPHPGYPLMTPTTEPQPLKFEVGPLPEKPTLDRSLTHIGTELTGYKSEQLEVCPWFEVQQLRFGNGLPLNGQLYDFGTNRSGFIRAHIRTEAPVRLLLTFDEILADGLVDPLRLGCVNVIQLELDPGHYIFESFEPYTMRYLAILQMEGECRIESVQLREFAHPLPSGTAFQCSDQRLVKIFNAALETLRQNSVDLFMDCPHRERAGYPCDSFFTARAYQQLFGTTAVEDDFLENFLVADAFEGIPEGMMPMCYPSDPLGGTYIPQWPMWLVVQLADYARRGGDPSIVEAFRLRIERLLAYLRPFENEHGLLEGLPGWNFVEWSPANEWTQDVSFPTNMLYSGFLKALAALYDKSELEAQADRVIETVTKMSFDGEFFVDNAERLATGLRVTSNHSEVCQYFAFFFGAATSETHPDLWLKLTKEFGPGRKASGAYPQVAPANAFIGNILRLELLPRDQVIEEMVGYFEFMADATGTLWENDGAYASCNHGFASYAAVLLIRKVLGLTVDFKNKTACMKGLLSVIGHCQAMIDTPDGPIAVSVNGEESSLRLPPGWRKVE